MSEVKRYDFESGGCPEEGAAMSESDDGEWVCYEDYAVLRSDLQMANERLGELTRERDGLRAEVEAHQRIAQDGHPSPCTLGALCPYCEIDRLRDRLTALERTLNAVIEAGCRCDVMKGFVCPVHELYWEVSGRPGPAADGGKEGGGWARD